MLSTIKFSISIEYTIKNGILNEAIQTKVNAVFY